MLKDLDIICTLPREIFEIIESGINAPFLDDPDCFKHYETGVYRHDFFAFNFEHFIENNTTNKIIDGRVDYGVCDDYSQILEKRAEIINNSDKNYVIGLTRVKRAEQPSRGGWKWRWWGEYIGTHEIKCEYLYDEEGIEEVYCYHIYEIE